MRFRRDYIMNNNIVKAVKKVALFVCIIMAIGAAVDLLIKPYFKKDTFVPKHNASVPLVKEMPWNDLGWRRAMQEDSDPKDMQLYLTKDYQMIWVSNDIADKYGRVKKPIIDNNQKSSDLLIKIMEDYVSIISYANVDHKNIKTDLKKKILFIIQEVFFDKTKWILGKSYKEIMSERPTADKIRYFCINDIDILKKGSNLCIRFNGENINPYHELEKTSSLLNERRIKTPGIQNFLLSNKPHS